MYKKNFENLKAAIEAVEKIWDEIDMEYLDTDERREIILSHNKAINELENIKHVFVEVIIRRADKKRR